MKEDCKESQILQAGNKLIKLLSCKHMLTFKKKKDDFEVGCLGPRGWSLKPQRIVSRSWDIMEFAQLGIQNCLGLVMPFFLPFSPFGNENIYNCYPVPVMQLCVGSKLFVFQFYNSTDGREILPRMDHAQSLLHTWFRLYGQWNLELLSWWYLGKILDLSWCC